MSFPDAGYILYKNLFKENETSLFSERKIIDLRLNNTEGNLIIIKGV